MHGILLLIVGLSLILTGNFAIDSSSTKGFNQVALWLYIICVACWGFTYIDAADIPSYIEFYEVGTVDWQKDGFQIPKYHAFENGFIFLGCFSRTISPHFYIFQFLLFSAELLLIMIGLKKLCGVNTMVAIICTLFVVIPINLLSALRQGVAIALFIYSLQFILTRKFIPYFVCLFVASLVHKSALFLLPFFWIDSISLIRKKKILWIILLVADAMYLSGFSLSSLLNILLENSLSFYDYAEEYSMYLENEDAISNYGVMKILEMNFVYVSFLIYYDTQEKWKAILKYLFLFYFVLNLLIGGILVHRITYYFEILAYVALILAFINLSTKVGFSANIGYTIACLYITFLFFFYFRQNSGDLHFSFMPAFGNKF